MRIWANVDATSAPAGEGGKRALQVRPPSVLASSQGEGRWIQVAIIDAGERSVYSVSWTTKPGAKHGDKDLGWLAAAGGDGVIRVWDMKVGLRVLPQFAWPNWT